MDCAAEELHLQKYIILLQEKHTCWIIIDCSVLKPLQTDHLPNYYLSCEHNLSSWNSEAPTFGMALWIDLVCSSDNNESQAVLFAG